MCGESWLARAVWSISCMYTYKHVCIYQVYTCIQLCIHTCIQHTDWSVLVESDWDVVFAYESPDIADLQTLYCIQDTAVCMYIQYFI